MIPATGPAARHLGRLTAPEVPTRLSGETVLCLPVGSQEQHGPHLPLNTDTVVAEQFTARLVQRYGDQHDLWALPAIPYGLSLEHAWAPGTVSLRINSFLALLDALVAEHLRATPARRLLIINGHGGNRGILEPALYELQQRHQLAVCVLHPLSLATAGRSSQGAPDIHASLRETAMMLDLAPDDVHLDRLPAAITPAGPEIQRLILDRGTTWPWTSDDTAISTQGVIGEDPRNATRKLGRTILDSAVENAATTLDYFTRPRS